MDKLDKTLGVTQMDRAATSGNATFAELVEVFKRDIDLSEREHSTIGLMHGRIFLKSDQPIKLTPSEDFVALRDHPYK